MVRGDDLGKGSEHVHLVQTGDDLLLKLFGHEVAAVLVNAFGKNVVQRGLAAQMPAEVLLVGGGRTTGLFRLGRLIRLLGDGLVDRLGEFGLAGFPALHALDLVGQVVQILLHVGVGGIVVSGQDALVIPVGIEEALHRVPQGGALGTKFVHSHGSESPFYMNFLMASSRALSSSTERPSGAAGSCSGTGAGADSAFVFSTSLLNRAWATARPEKE